MHHHHHSPQRVNKHLSSLTIEPLKSGCLRVPARRADEGISLIRLLSERENKRGSQQPERREI